MSELGKEYRKEIERLTAEVDIQNSMWAECEAERMEAQARVEALESISLDKQVP